MRLRVDDFGAVCSRRWSQFACDVVGIGITRGRVSGIGVGVTAGRGPGHGWAEIGWRGVLCRGSKLAS